MLWRQHILHKWLSTTSSFGSCTCNKVGQLIIDVHKTVGTGIPQASIWISLQFFPGWFCHRDVIEFEPALPGLVIYVGPVVTSICLALVNQDGMQAIRNLKIHMNRISRLIFNGWSNRKSMKTFTAVICLKIVHLYIWLPNANRFPSPWWAQLKNTSIHYHSVTMTSEAWPPHWYPNLSN